jgi:hypothetical protein
MTFRTTTGLTVMPQLLVTKQQRTAISCDNFMVAGFADIGAIHEDTAVIN